jgi:hypothetical protein
VEGVLPTVLRVGPYRFFFYAGDGNEPPHIHVEREDKVAKFWLIPVRLQKSGGFESSELAKLQRITEEYKQKLLKAWNDYFNS